MTDLNRELWSLQFNLFDLKPKQNFLVVTHHKSKELSQTTGTQNALFIPEYLF